MLTTSKNIPKYDAIVVPDIEPIDARERLIGRAVASDEIPIVGAWAMPKAVC